MDTFLKELGKRDERENLYVHKELGENDGREFNHSLQSSSSLLKSGIQSDNDER